MKTLKLALAGLVTAGAALFAAPEPAQAFYSPYGYGYYRPAFYPAYGYGYGYRRPFVRRVVVVRRPYYPAYGYYRPYVRRVVVVRRPFYPAYGYGYPRRRFHYGY